MAAADSSFSLPLCFVENPLTVFAKTNSGAVSEGSSR
jgi:hypothetical protein